LIERLNAGLQRKLTLISAPAGFGKTTLLAEWVGRLRLPTAGSGLETNGGQIRSRVAWVSLDEGDNDLVHFLAYLIAALQTVEASVTAALQPALQSPQLPPLEDLLAVLINQVASIPGKLVLVLDDYHLVTAPPIHRALTFLLSHLANNVHVVISTRADPPLPVARLRGRGQLNELRQADLRFTSAEVGQFLSCVAGLELAAEDVAALTSRSEGWVAGLQMALIAMQSQIRQGRDIAGFVAAFTGSHEHIADYLADEVLSQQSEELESFLLQTSILDRLTGSLCDAVTGESAGWRTLEKLQEANLFVVPLDGERRWYRYHHLFADLLRKRLHQRVGAQGISSLHRRASLWCEENGLMNPAIEHALYAFDWERAANLIERVAEATWEAAGQTTMLRWLEALPEELVHTSPQLCIHHAWVLFASGRLQAAERSIKAAQEALDSATRGAMGPSSGGSARPHAPGMAEKLGKVAVMRAHMASYRGDIPAIIRFSRQALEYLTEKHATWRSSAAIALGDAHGFSGDLVAANGAYTEAVAVNRAAGNLYLLLIASLKLAVNERHQGRLQRVVEVCRRVQRLVAESGLSQTAMAGMLLAVWGEVLCEWNDLDTAIDHVIRGCELCEQGKDVAMLGWSYLCLVRVLCSKGDMAGAEEAIQRLEALTRESDLPPFVANPVAAWKARLWLTTGRLEAAERLLRKRGLAVDDDIPYLREREYLTLARLLTIQGERQPRSLEEATKLLERLLVQAEAERRMWHVIEALVLQALSFQAQGHTDRALAALARALSLAEPEGCVRVFVDEGRPMARLLYGASARGISPEYAGRLLAAFPALEPAETSPKLPTEMIEPLSERELEVLRLIATGATNREIAQDLVIAVNTVKKHVSNILGKLEVVNRRQAARRARDLGLIE